MGSTQAENDLSTHWDHARWSEVTLEKAHTAQPAGGARGENTVTDCHFIRLASIPSFQDGSIGEMLIYVAP